METPQPPMGVRLRRIVSFFAVIIIYALHPVLTFTNSLAQYATQFDSHLPISLVNIIALAQNVLFKITAIALALGEILVLIVAPIRGLRYADEAQPISNFPAAAYDTFAPPAAGLQDESLPFHHSHTESTYPNPSPSDSHPVPEVVDAGTIDSWPIDEHPQAMPQIPALLLHMATSLLERYLKKRKAVDLAVSIDVLHVAKGLSASGHPQRTNVVNTLAIAMLIQYGRSRKQSYLSEAITLHREALDLLQPDEPAHSSSQIILKNAALAWCRQHGVDVGLLDVIDVRHEAQDIQQPGRQNQLPKESFWPTGSSPFNGPHRPLPQAAIDLHDAAVSNLERYQQEGRPAMLTESIQLFQQTLSLVPSAHPCRPSILNNLAVAYSTRYEREGRERDLAEAIALHREALSLKPPGHPDRPSSLNNLADAVKTRYEREGEVRDLSEAITLLRETLSLLPPGNPIRSASLNNLAVAVTTRYNRDGDVRDLSEAITLHREALSLFPPGNPNRSTSLNNLADAVKTRYNRDGDVRDLSEAITLLREALSLLPPGHPKRSFALNNLAIVVTTRYNWDGDVRDLSEAITLYREALSLQPPGHPDRSATLNNLANAVNTRYNQDGDVRDLSEAITLLREALFLFPPGNPKRSTLLDNLAGAVTTRYDREDDVRDLLEAITLRREALSLQPPSNPNRSASLNDLATAVTTRYEREGDVRDLSEAITLLREALSLEPPGHPERSASLNNLASAVIMRCELNGEMQDLSEAITLHREALSLLPPGHPKHSFSLNILATALKKRYERDGDVRDLSEAITLLREALSLRPLDDPNRSSILRALAIAILMRYRRTRGDQNLQVMEEIIQLLRDATAARTSPIPDRLEAALRWIKIAVKHHPESALQAYQSAFAHLSSALALASSLQARHAGLLSESRHSQPPKDLALEAALWVLTGASNNPMLAVELLDQGRNVLLASVGQFRADLSDVRRQDPTLADKFHRTSRLLDSAILTGREISEGKSPHEDPTSRYRRISSDWEDIVGKIRLLPDCDSFLLPVPYIKLQEAAVNGPVIVIVVGKERSIAIIVMPKGEPHTVDLPAASEEALKTLHRDMDAELRAPVRPDMRDVLSDLWKIVVQPIIQELQDVLLIPIGSRIWWYPTSWASFLPLHAAGSYTKGGLNVPKLYISSYTPTLQALRRSRLRFSSNLDRTAGTLIVSQAQTPGQVVLPSVNEEVKIVSSLVPDALLLSNDQGNRSSVLKELRNHSWIHLSCHGVRDPSDPFMSHFALHDGPLSLQDIITNDLPSADFAYLAACHSAAQDRALPDEGLTLAGGMQFAGFKSVVGTMWAMADEDAPAWADEFYESLAMRSGDGRPFDCTKAAESLHDAVIELRKKKVPMFRWINLVHYGI